MSVPTKEPLEIFAGDTVVWTKSFSDYPATVWTLTYRLLSRQGLEAQDFGGTTNGSDFTVALQAAFTADFAAGTYSLFGFVTDGTDRYQVYSGTLVVKPDPAIVSHVDGRTYLQRVLEKLEEVILEGVIRAPIRYSYGGVASEIMTLKDALDARDRVKAQIEQEAAVVRGKQRRILTRFTAPR